MIQIGVGLRTEHYEAAMNPASIDFIEVHAENFFTDGGASLALLHQVSQHYAISIHATSLGLGSVQPAPKAHLSKLKQLVDTFSPLLVSDHACFSWVDGGQSVRHAGDLLPIPFNKAMLGVMIDNIKRVQDVLGRQILVENITSYLNFADDEMPEYAFFNQLCFHSGCGLLLDLHNLYVNAVNKKHPQPLNAVQQHIKLIDQQYVKEIHLAGIQNTEQQPWVDDHSGPVSQDTWQSYQTAIRRFGNVPTLIEWDSRLPPWSTLLAEANRAKAYAKKVHEYA